MEYSEWSPGVTIEQIEEGVIKKALRFYQGNKTKTAQSLGIAVRTLDNKLSKYGMISGDPNSLKENDERSNSKSSK